MEHIGTCLLSSPNDTILKRDGVYPVVSVTESPTSIHFRLKSQEIKREDLVKPARRLYRC